jgi:hypothetical protein
MHIRYIVGALLVSSFVARSRAHHRGDRVARDLQVKLP